MTAAAVLAVAPDAGVPTVASGGRHPEFTWALITQRAPKMGATMVRYLDQVAVSAEPRTVEASDFTLRQFAGRVTEADPTCRCVAHITRTHFEDYKTWLARRPGRKGTLANKTIGNRLGQLRTFFERTIEWGYDDAPARVPIFAGDFGDHREHTVDSLNRLDLRAPDAERRGHVNSRDVIEVGERGQLVPLLPEEQLGGAGHALPEIAPSGSEPDHLRSGRSVLLFDEDLLDDGSIEIVEHERSALGDSAPSGR